MIAGGLETVFARGVAHGTPLSARVHVAVGTASVAFRVRFLFELHPVALRVRRTELAVVGQVSGVRQDGRDVLLLSGHQRHQRRRRHQDEYLFTIRVCYNFMSLLLFSIGSFFFPPSH